LYTCPRAATVVAQKDTTLFRVDQNTFRFILRNQTQNLEKEKMKLLRGVDFFAELSSVDLDKLSKVMTPRVFTPDVVLCKKGERGDVFYVLQEGSVLISDISVGSCTYADQTLGPGQYFGERSLVTGEPRAANVTAKTHGVAFTIDRSTFQATVGKISDIISRSQDGRRLAGVKLFQGVSLTPKQVDALAQAMEDVCYPSGKSIVQEGDLTDPALYFVRKGKVKIEKKGKIVEIPSGGFFGDETMILAVRKHLAAVPSSFVASSVGETTVAMLCLSKCRSIFDVQLLVGRSSEAFSMGEIESDDDDDEEDLFVERLKTLRLTQDYKPKIRPKVKLEDLEKIKLLGTGTFGQVWLVSDKKRPSKGSSVFALKVQVGAT
jgi:CRP-like cAMP-binding protein